MAAVSPDAEFNKYWLMLTPVQKESILGVIKSFVSEERTNSIEQYNLDIDEAVNRVEEGEFFTHEEVKKMQ
jgi:hypothetical protein